VVVTQDAEATASGPITPEDALALGEHLTEALASGDVEAWLERTDLDESAEQQQRDWFAGVQAVPMDLREMHPTFLVRVDDGAGGALVRYAFRHQVTGVDAVPVIELYDLTLTPSASGWRVAAVSGGDSDDAGYPRLWDLGPIVVHESRHSIVIDPGHGVDDSLLRGINEAVEAAQTEMPVEGSSRLLIELSDPDAMQALTRRNTGGGPPTALSYFPLASPEVERTGIMPDVEDGETGAPRIVVDARSLVEDARTAAGFAGGLPMVRERAISTAAYQRHFNVGSFTWVDVGLGWWFASAGDDAARQDVEATYAAHLAEGGEPLFPPAGYWEFYADSAPQSLYTVQAVTIFRYVEHVHGRDVVFPLAEELLRVVPGTRAAETALDKAFERHLGMSAAEVEADWAEWVREEFDL